MRMFVKMSLMLIASAIIGSMLMILVYMLPVEGMKRNLRGSIDMLMKEGVRNSWAGFSYKRPPRHMNDNDVSDAMNTIRLYAIIDGQTDGTMLNMAVYRSGNAVHDAMMNPSLSYRSNSEFSNSIEVLSKVLNDNNHEESSISTYPRYWHGYLIYLKPILMLFGMPGIRVINLILQFILLIMVILKMSQKIGKAYACAFSLAVLVIDPVASVICLQYSDVYYITLLSMLVILSKNDSLRRTNRDYFLFMFTGIFTSFFDFLTYPFASLGMPAILYMLMNDDKLSGKFLSMIKMSLSWGFGYFGMWASKWVIASLVTGHNVIINGINAALSRTGGYIRGLDVTWPHLFSYASSMRLFVPGVLILFAVIITSCLLIYISVRKGYTSASEIIPLCMTFLYPFVWYAVLKQHSINHYFFTYKLLSVSVFAVLCIIIKCLGYKHNG